MGWDTFSNNKRIAKNTLLLYIRMFIMTLIGLFTSRVVLQVLGVEDFGIYNVVGGIVAMMGILNSAMSVASQRYITFELGKGKENFRQLNKTFCISLNIYALLALIFLIFAETLGVWCLNNILNIPSDRIIAANWIFQFSVLTIVGSLFLNPYNAIIIAHEKMDIYAYMSVIEAVLKLSIVYLLLVIPYDNLIIYGMLYMLVSLITTIVYFIYCRRHFPEVKYKYYHDGKLFMELVSYSGWNLFGSASVLVKGQGLNILLNMFFNPSVNAARGIAYQINAHITMFFSNFYTAVRPQITKYYASGDLKNMFKLVFRSSKMSYYLILFISLPVIIEASYIVNLWLGQLPEYVVPFVRVIVVISAIDSMATPLMTTVHSTGRIAFYQSVVGTLNMLNLPISYCFLKFATSSPIVVFVISLVIAIVSLFARLWMVKRVVNFPITLYIKEVFGTAMLVTVTAPVIPIIAYQILDETILTVCFICLLCFVCTIVAVMSLGLKTDERVFLINMLKNKMKINNAIGRTK